MGEPVPSQLQDSKRAPKLLRLSTSTLESLTTSQAEAENALNDFSLDREKTVENLISTRWPTRGSIATDGYQARLIDRKSFKWAITFIILLSSVQMGLEAQFHDPRWNPIWQVCEHLATAAF